MIFNLPVTVPTRRGSATGITLKLSRWALPLLLLLLVAAAVPAFLSDPRC